MSDVDRRASTADISEIRIRWTSVHSHSVCSWRVDLKRAPYKWRPRARPVLYCI